MKNSNLHDWSVMKHLDGGYECDKCGAQAVSIEKQQAQRCPRKNIDGSIKFDLPAPFESLPVSLKIKKTRALNAYFLARQNSTSSSKTE